MSTKLVQLENRIDELRKLADEVQKLSEQFFRGVIVQPELSTKGERWVRGARELLVQHHFSGLGIFDECYKDGSWSTGIGSILHRARADFYEPAFATSAKQSFNNNFLKARGLLDSVIEEMKSRELPIKTALSLALSSDEMDTAQELLSASKGNESVVRASGVVARVGLERHLFTVIESRGLSIQLNPPTKKKPTAGDALATLHAANVITAIQKSELDSLFTIANHCAHPKEVVTAKDVERLVERGRELASVIS